MIVRTNSTKFRITVLLAMDGQGTENFRDVVGGHKNMSISTFKKNE